MVVSNIKWNVTLDEISELINTQQVSSGVIARLLDVPYSLYKSLSLAERCESVRDAIHHNRIDAAVLVELPDKIEIPAEIGDNEENIANWISDEFGYCIEGFDYD